jgi:hypothetical protein
VTASAYTKNDPREGQLFRSGERYVKADLKRTQARVDPLGFSDGLAAYQLGHSDAELIRNLYGHGHTDALDRLNGPLASRFARSVPHGCHKHKVEPHDGVLRCGPRARSPLLEPVSPISGPV